MPDMIVRIQVIKVYDVEVTAANADEALDKVNSMQSTVIEMSGSLQDVTTDYAEVVDLSDSDDEPEDGSDILFDQPGEGCDHKK